jgi:hypothetical protein
LSKLFANNCAGPSKLVNPKKKALTKSDIPITMSITRALPGIVLKIRNMAKAKRHARIAPTPADQAKDPVVYTLCKF